MILRLCDELDKASELYAYYKDLVQDYIKNKINNELKKLEGEGLLKAYVKSWQ